MNRLVFLLSFRWVFHVVFPGRARQMRRLLAIAEDAVAKKDQAEARWNARQAYFDEAIESMTPSVFADLKIRPVVQQPALAEIVPSVAIDSLSDFDTGLVRYRGLFGVVIVANPNIPIRAIAADIAEKIRKQDLDQLTANLEAALAQLPREE